MADQPAIAVIGAGLAGLTCARRLAEVGCAVDIFEKSRGIGGRIATRRRGGLHVDHGTPFLRPETAEGQALLAIAPSAPWPEAALPGAHEAHVFIPGMKDLLRPLSEGLSIRFSSEITALTRTADGCRLTDKQGLTRKYDRVVLTMPAPQVLRLGDGLGDELRDELAQVEFAPCYALLLAFDQRPDWSVFQYRPDATFDLVLRDSAKPGRPADGEYWLAHASEEWSRRNLELTSDAAAQALLTALKGLMGALPKVNVAHAHRWRFARTTRPLGRGFAETPDGRVLVGGDWAFGRNAEDAMQSGKAMAERVLAQLNSR